MFKRKCSFKLAIYNTYLFKLIEKFPSHSIINIISLNLWMGIKKKIKKSINRKLYCTVPLQGYLSCYCESI